MLLNMFISLLIEHIKNSFLLWSCSEIKSQQNYDGRGYTNNSVFHTLWPCLLGPAKEGCNFVANVWRLYVLNISMVIQNTNYWYNWAWIGFKRKTKFLNSPLSLSNLWEHWQSARWTVEIEKWACRPAIGWESSWIMKTVFWKIRIIFYTHIYSSHIIMSQWIQ